MIVTKIDRE